MNFIHQAKMFLIAALSLLITVLAHGKQQLPDNFEVKYETVYRFSTLLE